MLTIDARVAPAPIVTNNAGNAQHSKVDIEVNRLRVGNIIFLLTAIIINSYYVIAGIDN